MGVQLSSLSSSSSLGSLSNDDDSEDVAKKKLRSFRLYRVYLDPLYMSRVLVIRTLSRFKKRKENSSSYVHVLHKVEIKSWHINTMSRRVVC